MAEEFMTNYAALMAGVICFFILAMLVYMIRSLIKKFMEADTVSDRVFLACTTALFILFGVFILGGAAIAFWTHYSPTA